MHYRHRTQRPIRYNIPGHAHELTFSCIRGFPLLKQDEPCRWLADAIERARRSLHFSVWAYVFMPNHVHLIICPRSSKYSISEILRRIKEPVGRLAVNRWKLSESVWLKRVRVEKGSRVEFRFWQPGGGFDRNIESARALYGMVDYIHQNPMRKTLVTSAADWKWSSAGWFVETPLNELRPDTIPVDWLDTVS